MHISCILCIYYVYSMCIVRSHFRSRFALCSEICVQYSCVKPAAMSDFPNAIRIWKGIFGYVYTYVGDGTYKCERGSDWCGTNEVRWLRKDERDGLWYAFDAPDCINTPTFVEHEKAIFKSADADVLIPGWHTWTLVKTPNHAEGEFQTTLIED